jgi:transcriptional regulator with XRE-family HTH domain
VTLKAAAARYQITRAALAVSRDDLRAAVLVELAKGTSEVEVARRAGVTRMTIRAWRNGSVVSSDH